MNFDTVLNQKYVIYPFNDWGRMQFIIKVLKQIHVALLV